MLKLLTLQAGQNARVPKWVCVAMPPATPQTAKLLSQLRLAMVPASRQLAAT